MIRTLTSAIVPICRGNGAIANISGSITHINCICFCRPLQTLQNIRKRGLSTTVELSEIDYELRAEATLLKLSEYFDSLPELIKCDHHYDVTYAMGVLTIQISPLHGTYVINKQTPNRQIWLSSPISGPKRYDLNAFGKWIYKHDGVSLNELLQNELRSIYKTDLIDLAKL